MNKTRIERLREKLLDEGQPSLRPVSLTESSEVRPEVRALYARVRPFAEAMFLVMSTDDRIADHERDALRGALRNLTGGVLSSREMERMLNEFAGELARDGRELRLDHVASMLYARHEDRQLALALAAAAAIADGELGPAEQAAIEGLAERLGVTPSLLEEFVAAAG